MWFRVDDGFIRHRKVSQAALALGGPEHIGRVVAVWLEAGLWASSNLSDGFVPDIEVAVFRTDPKGRPAQVMDACAAARLVDRVAGVEPGYQFHDWDHYQPAARDIKAKRERDRARKRPGVNGHAGPRAFLVEPATTVEGIVTASEVVPARFHSESAVVPSGELSARARASAGDPDPVPDPLEKQESSARRALPSPGASRVSPMARVRCDVWEVRPQLLAAIHALLDAGAPYVDAHGDPVPSELMAELKVIASRHLGATWQGRELQAILDAALGRRASMREALVARESFRRRERQTIAALGGVC